MRGYKSKCSGIAMAVVAAASGPAAAFGDEIVVPDEFSLSAAVTFAKDGDTIIVTPEDSPYDVVPEIAWMDKALTIRGSTGDPADVVLDGFNNNVIFRLGEGTGGSVLENLTFRNGSADDTGGGAVHAEEFVTISNCMFNDNTAINPGGAVRCSAGATIRNSIFSGNSVTGAGADAGAVFMNGGELYTIEYCLFENNQAVNTGGAIRIDASDGQVTGSVFSGNSTATDSDQLGGACFSRLGSDITYDACLFVDNSTEHHGGAIASLDSGTLSRVHNCIFQRNHADLGGGAIGKNTGKDETGEVPVPAYEACDRSGS